MLNKNIWTQILCLIGCFMADCTVWSGYLKFFFHISVKHRVTCKTSLHKIMELRHVYSPIYHHLINAWKTLVGIHHYTCGNNKTCGKMLSRLWPIITTFQNMDIGTCNKIDCLPQHTTDTTAILSNTVHGNSTFHSYVQMYDRKFISTINYRSQLLTTLFCKPNKLINIAYFVSVLCVSVSYKT